MLRALATRKETTRQQIMSDTGLSKATVARIVRELLSEGRVVEGRAIVGPSGGRATKTLQFRGVTDLVCGIDMGGTNSRFLLVSQRGRLVSSWRRENPPSYSARALADWVADQVIDACHDSERPEPSVTVIGVPGVVGSTTGHIRNSPNLAAVEGRTFTERLSWRMPGRLVVENDSNVALVGELRAGAAAGARNAVMLTIGTGVGAGVAVDGRLLSGPHGGVGEFGIVPIDLDGTTLEEVISGPAIVAAAKARGLADTRPEAVLQESHDLGQLELQRRLIAAMFSVAVAISVAYEPSVIVIGGGVSPSLASALPDLQRRLDKALEPAPALVLSKLGDPAGALGAIAIGLEMSHQMMGAANVETEDTQLNLDIAAIAAELTAGSSP
ncbi:MAG: ROK family protein [Acidimicrobiales bacterium]